MGRRIGLHAKNNLDAPPCQEKDGGEDRKLGGKTRACRPGNREEGVDWVYWTGQSVSIISTTNLAACVCPQNLTNFWPYAFISSPNVPKILFA